MCIEKAGCAERRANGSIVPRFRRMVFFWTTLALTVSASVFAQEDDPAVVPYRPSVATPAELPAPGWPELEAGWNGTKGGDVDRSHSTPMLFKLAWNDSWAFLAGTDAFDWQRDSDGNSSHSGGDTTLTLKYQLPINETVDLGAELGVLLPTARRPIGTGHSDWGVNTIASFDFDATHIDVNVGATELGEVDDGQGHWQGAWAVAVSRPLRGQFGLTGEVSGLVQRGASAQSQCLVAVNDNVSRKLVLDMAVAAGLSHAAPDWQLMAGLTVQLGHWF